MSNQWLAIQNFQRSQDLLAAINNLSIHLKLESAGKSSDERREQADEARATLQDFLERMETVISESEGEELKPVLGVNPRTRQLAKSFMSAKRDRHRFRSALFRQPLTRARQLLDAKEEEDQQALLQFLEELRVLVGEHVHRDAERVLGEF